MSLSGWLLVSGDVIATQCDDGDDDDDVVVVVVNDDVRTKTSRSRPRHVRPICPETS